ncbi:MAG: UvrD-helicase domain-containing protein, partial [Vicinamibacterales bacterium]
MRRRIEVDTYHAFFWRLIKSHGYLVGLPRRLRVLAPPDEAVVLSAIRSQFPAKGLSVEQRTARLSAIDAERMRLAMIEGRVCFDYYARFAGDLLHRSARLGRLVGTMYPYVILDEFQDTNASQWRVVQALGTHSTLAALADPDQRIFDWLGADPERLAQFRAAFNPEVIDLTNSNYRSSGTDIARFGDDILSGEFRQRSYVGVDIATFRAFQAPALTKLVTTVYAARSRMSSSGLSGWSVAVLVPTKKMTRIVSEALSHPPSGLTPVAHVAALDMEAAVLAAEVIAWVIQPGATNSHCQLFIELVCNFYKGKGGGEPTRAALDEARRIEAAHNEYL